MATSNTPKSEPSPSASADKVTQPSTTSNPVNDAIAQYSEIKKDLSGPEPVWCYGKFCQRIVG